MYIVILAEPCMKKFHSSEVRCQWSSRIAPGSIVTSAAARSEAIGKFAVSINFILPPGTV
jgi:hypothetical protein